MRCGEPGLCAAVIIGFPTQGQTAKNAYLCSNISSVPFIWGSWNAWPRPWPNPSPCWQWREADFAHGLVFCSKNFATQDGTTRNPKQEYLIFLSCVFLHPLAQGKLAGQHVAPSRSIRFFVAVGSQLALNNKEETTWLHSHFLGLLPLVCLNLVN